LAQIGNPTHRLRYKIIATFSFVGILIPIIAHASEKSYEQEFLVTAYYSPLPDQSVYFKGTYEGDIEFNGGGIEGADHTPVYAGMAAAPESYPFGTRIDLPGIGIVTVHDRGGRIVEGNGFHRIDLWMGRGEEGLARAMEFGAKVVKGTAYPPGTTQPQESFDLAHFPAPPEALVTLGYSIVSLLDDEDVVREERSQRVSALHKALLDLGYFSHAITGYFGPVTADAVTAFQKDAGFAATPDFVNQETRTAIVLHHAARRVYGSPFGEDSLMSGDSGEEVRALQRMLKLLGYFQGGITGLFDQRIRSSVLLFQRAHGIVASEGNSGAGVFGPRTRQALLTAWRAGRMDTAADTLLAMLGRGS
jgi:peptidoglycan hydrolase-like protein with peptidoglycan-binding domain/3D (Asp-Asp-Asp) domain-containing protein